MAVRVFANNRSPLAERAWPLLAYDAWQHAYIRKYGADEAGASEALRQWWTLVEWDNVDALDRYWTGQLLDDRLAEDEKLRQKPWTHPPRFVKPDAGFAEVKRDPVPRDPGAPLDLTKYGKITIGVKPEKRGDKKTNMNQAEKKSIEECDENKAAKDINTKSKLEKEGEHGDDLKKVTKKVSSEYDKETVQANDINSLNKEHVVLSSPGDNIEMNITTTNTIKRNEQTDIDEKNNKENK